MLTGHGGLDDALLQRPSVLSRGPGPEIVKAKPPGQFPAWVLPFPAPFATGPGAGVVPQPTHQPPRLGKLMPHPGRHDGIAPRHRQPCQRVGQLPRMLSGVFHRRQGLRPARRSGKTAFNGPKRLPIGRSRRAAQVGKAPVEPDAVIRAGQPVPGREQVRVRFIESPLLIVEHLQHQPGVQLGIVPASPSQRPVLIVLHQVVIGIAGKGQGIEPERVHHRQVQQLEARVRGPQVGQVEIDQVVAQHEVRAVGQLVQPGQRLAQVAADPRDGHLLTRIRPHAGQGVNPVIRPADLQVQRQAARKGVFDAVRRRSRIAPPRFHAPGGHVAPLVQWFGAVIFSSGCPAAARRCRPRLRSAGPPIPGRPPFPWRGPRSTRRWWGWDCPWP